jgi:hypothetical protein
MFEEHNTTIVRKMDAYPCKQRRRRLSSAGIEVPSSGKRGAWQPEVTEFLALLAPLSRSVASLVV